VPADDVLSFLFFFQIFANLPIFAFKGFQNAHGSLGEKSPRALRPVGKRVQTSRYAEALDYMV
jgi:hypothetical protein